MSDLSRPLDLRHLHHANSPSASEVKTTIPNPQKAGVRLPLFTPRRAMRAAGEMPPHEALSHSRWPSSLTAASMPALYRLERCTQLPFSAQEHARNGILPCVYPPLVALKGWIVDGFDHLGRYRHRGQ